MPISEVTVNSLGDLIDKVTPTEPEPRDQLDLVSVDERRLLPDLDGVAAEMRRYYS